MNIKLKLNNTRETYLLKVKEALSSKEMGIQKFDTSVVDLDIETLPFIIEKHHVTLQQRFLNYDEACISFFKYNLIFKGSKIK
jgi:hypothetical protein